MKTASDIIKGSKYGEKLNSEQWREFSKDTKERRGNYCQSCKRGNVELHVHHIFYDSTREPWQYQDKELAVLCKQCHFELHEQLQKFRKFVFGKMTPRVAQVINGALAVALENYEPLVFAHALAEFVGNPSLVQRYAKAWDVNAFPKPEEQVAFEAFQKSIRKGLI